MRHLHGIKLKLKYLTLVFIYLVLVSCSKNENNPVQVQDEKAEALDAFYYLNKVRQNPPAYSQEIGVDLSGVLARPELKWNEILKMVAEDKANDMAQRDYFAHITPEGYGINYYINKAGYTLPAEWLKDSSANNFESLAAAYKAGVVTTGIDLIKQMIVDKDVPDLGHRIHLLGMNAWNSNMKDIGIGFARNPSSKYQNYICVIIAKHSN